MGVCRCDIIAVDYKLDFFGKYDVCDDFWILFPADAGNGSLYAKERGENNAVVEGVSKAVQGPCLKY